VFKNTEEHVFEKKNTTMIVAYRQQNEILFEISIDVKKKCVYNFIGIFRK